MQQVACSLHNLLVSDAPTSVIPCMRYIFASSVSIVLQIRIEQAKTNIRQIFE